MPNMPGLPAAGELQGMLHCLPLLQVLSVADAHCKEHICSSVVQLQRVLSLVDVIGNISHGESGGMHAVTLSLVSFNTARSDSLRV